ncbi:MAG: hypothetical protein KGJ62_09525 [Armatimonadetes bacterium]|nr:hypothetical protein [Armatimonadota bacterium]MDE2205816.1 hypothetical protein [Armatimonadota bacterium]
MTVYSSDREKSCCPSNPPAGTYDRELLTGSVISRHEFFIAVSTTFGIPREILTGALASDTELDAWREFAFWFAAWAGVENIAHAQCRWRGCWRLITNSPRTAAYAIASLGLAETWFDVAAQSAKGDPMPVKATRRTERDSTGCPADSLLKRLNEPSHLRLVCCETVVYDELRTAMGGTARWLELDGASIETTAAFKVASMRAWPSGYAAAETDERLAREVWTGVWDAWTETVWDHSDMPLVLGWRSPETLAARNPAAFIHAIALLQAALSSDRRFQSTAVLGGDW